MIGECCRTYPKSNRIIPRDHISFAFIIIIETVSMQLNYFPSPRLIPRIPHQTSCSIFLTLGTLLTLTPANAATISICPHSPLATSNNPFFLKKTRRKHDESNTYTLLHYLHILKTHTHTSRPTQMPSRLQFQILDHDAGEDDHFGVNGVQDAVVGKVEAVGYVGGDPA